MARYEKFRKEIDLSDGGLRFRLEREKAKAMVKIFESEPLVRTPLLLSDSPETGVLLFEYMENIQPVKAWTRDSWFEVLGESLGKIHKSLLLPPDLVIERKRDIGRSGLVFVHGDFWRGNIGLCEGKLVIFDWGVKAWATEVYSLATPAVDLAMFMTFWLVPRRYHPLPPFRKLMRFLRSYLHVIGPESEAGILARSTLEEVMMENYLRIESNEYHGRGFLRNIQKALTLWNIRRFKNELRQ